MKIRKLKKFEKNYIKECDKLFIDFMKSESKYDDNTIVLEEYASFAKDLEKENKHMYVALEDEKVVAFLYSTVEKSKVMKVPVAHINYIYVKDEYRHKGIAFSLFKKVMQDYQTIDIENIELNVFNDNEFAVRLYEKIGFKPVYTNYKLKL